MVLYHSNPDIDQAIGQLSESIERYIKAGSTKLKVLKNDVTRQVGIIRQNQYEMDVKLLKLYDSTVKVNSFLCLCNRQSKCEVEDLDKLKFHFNPLGEKGKQIKPKTFMKKFMKSRDPLIDFFEGVEAAREQSSPTKSMKFKRNMGSFKAKFKPLE